MANLAKIGKNRLSAQKLSPAPEIEQFGSDGEELVYRTLKENFSCVRRNVVVPHKDLLLEKDFLVIEQGVPFVLEVKNWKGEISMEGDFFYQDKENGVRKKLKSPVGTTNQFLRCMKSAYGLDIEPFGVVVFVEGDCVLRLPAEYEGVALLPLSRAVSHIRTLARANKPERPTLSPDSFLRCTRFYSEDGEFCKGVAVDCELPLFNENGDRVVLDTTRISYLSADHRPLLFQDKIYVTFCNGATGVYYNRDTSLTVKLLDGSFQKIAINRIRHIVF